MNCTPSMLVIEELELWPATLGVATTNMNKRPIVIVMSNGFDPVVRFSRSALTFDALK